MKERYSIIKQPNGSQNYCDGVRNNDTNEEFYSIDELVKELNTLSFLIEDLYESDKSLRKLCGGATHNWTGISIKRDLYEKILKTLIENGYEDLADELNKTSIDASVNGCGG